MYPVAEQLRSALVREVGENPSKRMSLAMHLRGFHADRRINFDAITKTTTTKDLLVDLDPESVEVVVPQLRKHFLTASSTDSQEFTLQQLIECITFSF